MSSLEGVAGSVASGLIFIALPLLALAYLVWSWNRRPAVAGARGRLDRVARAAAIASSGLGLFLVLAPLIEPNSLTEFRGGGTLAVPLMRFGTYLAIAGLVLSLALKGPARWKLGALCGVLVIYWFLVVTLQ